VLEALITTFVSSDKAQKCSISLDKVARGCAELREVGMIQLTLKVFFALECFTRRKSSSREMSVAGREEEKKSIFLLFTVHGFPKPLPW
jgi:hypothetical protein